MFQMHIFVTCHTLERDVHTEAVMSVHVYEHKIAFSSNSNFCTATLILLVSLLVSLNPGPSGSDFIRMATLNVRSLT